ncbi:ABC transporter ATP-binding protein [Albibacterium indicum]|uniref:ABC transporter ATP-binding protein n=1 Tax=Albibacterium indicum TaxID=2292082 RepID=UPI000E4F4612|nr:ABC transporter ATP-binding protein [Pedobacter indicus]
MIRAAARRIRVIKSNLNVLHILKFIWKVSPKKTLISLGCILIETGIFFVSLYALKLLIDTVSENTDNIGNPEVINSLILAAVSGIAYIAIKSLSVYISEVQSQTIAEHISDEIHEKTIALDLAFYESPDYYDMLNRALNAGSDRPVAVINTLFEILKTIMSLVAFGMVLITIDWTLLPILALFVIPTMLVRISFADKFNAWRIRQTPLERQSQYYSTLITTEQHAKEVRSYDLGKYFKNAFMKVRMTLLGEKLKISKDRTKNEVITASLSSIGFFSCIAYIILGSRTNSIGDITVFLVIFPQSFTLLQNLSTHISTLYHHNIFINSIFELFELKPSLQEPQRAEPVKTHLPVNFEFKNVNFSYPNTSKKVLQDISFKVKSRQIISIVGMNGAGKTTLIKMLCRFYDPQAGQILMDGKDIRNYASKDYRKQIGMVFQDFAKYQVSAADNIRFGNLEKEFKLTEIKEAAEKSGANVFIEKFPKQYDNMMGRIFDNGHEVSIGQWQKLANARCLYSDARLLIFDEATSALDAQAEKEFFDDFRRHIGDRAAIIISHRHSAVKNADHIYVLSGGRISQSGTDEELLNQDGDYANLFKKDSELEPLKL